MDDSKQSVAVFDPETDEPIAPRRRWLRSIAWSAAHLLVGMGLSAGVLWWWHAKHPAQTDELHTTNEVEFHDEDHDEDQTHDEPASDEHGESGDHADDSPLHAHEDADSESPLDDSHGLAEQDLPEASHEADGHGATELEDSAEQLSSQLQGKAGRTRGPSQTQRLTEADVEFVGGEIEKALKLYNELLAETTRLRTDALLYRRALCFEKLKERDQALREYQRIAKSDADSVLVAACVFGQARILTELGRLDAARALIYPQVLRLAREPRALSYGLHQLAYLATAEVARGVAIPGSYDALIDKRQKQIVMPILAQDNEDLLRLAQSNISEKQDAAVEAIEPGFHLLKRLGEGPQEIHLSWNAEDRAIPQLLDDLSLAIGTPILINDHLKPLLAKRTVSALVQELDLALLLDSVLEPSGATWLLREGQLMVIPLHDQSREEIDGLRRQRAARHGQSALTFFPDDENAVTTFLCLGNVSFWQGEYSEAVRWYRRAEGPGKVGEWVAAAWFNHARSHMILGQREDAREAFFRAADLSRRKELESISYLYLGSLFLEDSRVDEAIRELNRALLGKVAVPDAAISLASAYLLIENPETANMILYKYRDRLQTSPYDSQAMVVSALARLQAAASDALRIRQGRELASALAAAEPQKFFSSVGYLVIGQGYDQIGQPGEMESVFTSAMRDLPASPLRDQMAFLLGNYLMDEHRWDEAEALWTPLAKSETPTEWSRKAQLALAQLAFDSNDLDRCLQICYDLILTTDSLKEKETLLRLMGQSYERKSDHYRAAICFAGMVPVNESNSVAPAIRDASSD